MPIIYVCPWRELERLARLHRPSHVVSLLDPQDWPETPEGVAPERHHRVGVYDYAERLPGMVVPEQEHVAGLIAFLAGWDGTTPLLVHCWAGISRSSATALVALALRHPGREADAARLLRARSAIAAPNRRIIALADRHLQLDGRLVEAVAAIGPGRSAWINEPFSLALDLRDEP